MTDDELLHDAGPESRNLRGAAFESQLEAMGDALGWRLVCRSVDLFLKKNRQSRGVDLLWSVGNPRADEAQGWLQEAKNHDSQAPSAIAGEMQALHDKVARLADAEARKSHHHVGPAFKDVVGGILCHRSQRYQPSRSRDALLGLELRNKERGRHALRLLFYGTDTLQAIADCFAKYGAPEEFFWPPTAHHRGIWHPACPPEQLAAGLLAYRSREHGIVLWLRDTLVHHDVPAIAAIAHAWGVDPQVVVCSELTRDALRLVGKQWAEQAEQSRKREFGHLPDSVQPRNVSYDEPNVFDDLWPAAELAGAA